MTSTPDCANCRQPMISSEMKVGHESVYLVSHQGESSSIMNVFVCPQCGKVMIKAASPEKLGEEQSNDYLDQPPYS